MSDRDTYSQTEPTADTNYETWLRECALPEEASTVPGQELGLAAKSGLFSGFAKLLIVLVPLLFLAGYYTYSSVSGANFFGITIRTNVNLENGLVGHWTFDGGDMLSTSTVSDVSGNGNTGQLATSSSLTAGKIGQGLRSEGDGVTFAGSESLDIRGSLTMSIWANLDTIPDTAEERFLFYKATDDWELYRFLVYNDGGGPVLNFRPGTGGDYFSNSSVMSISAGTWYHFTVTYNADTDVITFYKDGIKISEASDTVGGGYAGGNKKLYIGGLPGGKVDDARIYNRVLSSKEIQALYNIGEGSKINVTETSDSLQNGLAGWWTFDGMDINRIDPIVYDTDWVFTGSDGVLAGGTLSWANTVNITSSNNVRAYANLSGTAQSNYLRASNFGFNIPVNATIVGIEGDIERRRSGGSLGQPQDYSVRLVDDTGAFVGDNKAFTGFDWPSTEIWACDEFGCYGGPSDTWGTTLTPVQVNDPDFGFAIQVTGNSAGADRIAEVDSIDLKIYYIINTEEVQDKSGNNNHGTISGARATAGKIGQGMDFDGINSYINAGSITSLDDIDKKTFCAWIYSATTSNMFASKWWVGSNWGWWVYADNGLLYYAHTFDGNGNNYWNTVSPIVQTDTWQHLCVSYDRTSASNDPSFYLNGTLQPMTTTFTPTGASRSDAGGSLYVGYYPFNGSMDDVRIYNRILSEAEVKKLYNEAEGVTLAQSEPDLIPDGLVGYWSFNGQDFTDKVYDRSGQGNHGYVIGSATSTLKTMGKVGQGIKLDGVDDYITIPDSSSLDITGTLTISAWIYSTGVATNGWGDIVVKSPCDGNESCTQSTNYWLQLLDISGTEYLDFYLNNEGNTGESRSLLPVSSNTWHHVALTYDDAENSLIYYIDGIGDTGTEYMGTNPSLISASTNNNPVRIGYSYQNQAFPGRIDEVRIYNRTLTSAEVRQLYNSGK